ncbi:MAG: PadR family transcriptional regulator [Geminicoccaceae bacterium]
MDTKTLCLGVLTEGARSGYEIKKCLETNFRHFFAASFGSIYPALAELERSGFVLAEDIVQSGKPDKRVYTLTADGLNRLREELASEPPKHKVRSEFLLLMYYAHLLPEDRLSEILDQMIGHFEQIMWEDLEVYERDHVDLTPGQRFALGYGRTVLTSALAYMKRQKQVLLSACREGHHTTRDRSIAGPEDQRPDGVMAAAGD